jgi:hypothetical protein
MYRRTICHQPLPFSVFHTASIRDEMADMRSSQPSVTDSDGLTGELPVLRAWRWSGPGIIGMKTWSPTEISTFSETRVVIESLV